MSSNHPIHEGHPNHKPKRSHGFTLIEVIVAMTVSLMVIVGLQSCLTLALRTIPRPSSPRQREIAAMEVMNQLNDDLQYALWINESTPSRIVMVVPDRDRDGRPERIVYRWTSSGVGDVLRQYNRQPERVLISRVSSFAVDLQSEEADIEVPGLVQAGSTVRLDGYDQTTSNVGFITNTSHCAQWLRPTLPSGGSLWRPTEVRLSVWKHSGASQVQIRGGPGLNSRLPAADSLTSDSQLFSSGLASVPNRTTFLTPGSPWMQRNQSYCVRIIKTDPAAANSVYKLAAGSNLVLGGSAGWQHSSTQSMAYEMDGQWASVAADRTLSLAHWTTARVRCQADASVSATLITTSLLNTPGRWSRRWKVCDGIDPVDADDDADGSADWQPIGSTLYESTDHHNLSADAIIDVNWRCLTAGGEGTVLINAFRSGTTCRPVRLRLSRQADQTHYLMLENPSPASARPLFALGGLDLETVRTRLILDNNEKSVSLLANGVPRGSFALSTSSAAMSAPAIQFGSAGGGVEVELFDVRVWQ